MIQNYTLALGLTACIIFTGCNDKIEEANQVPVKSPSTAQAQESVQPSLNMSAPHTDGSLSVADLYSKKGELNGKVVTITGNVVKVSDGIMGKSWIHIQDGTGSKETNDIVFTSATQTAQVGDHVTAKGTLHIDKDFGYGYFYPVIVEEATFSN
ncbi:MAG: hypothetical protein PHU29_11250 [Sulfuricurvum sp.]|nr:hypothetical protein [Sulfuricurvum sp.]